MTRLVLVVLVVATLVAACTTEPNGQVSPTTTTTSVAITPSPPGPTTSATTTTTSTTTTTTLAPVGELAAGPSGLHVASWTGGTANMGFTDNSDNEDGFYVYGDGRLEATLGANVTTFSWTTACGQVRAVSVTAFNATGESGATNTINVAGEDCTDDEPPSGLHVASWTGGTANMGFTDNSDNEDGFYVYGDGRLEATLGANVTTFSWTTACGQVRAVSVTAFNATGESGATNTINVAGEDCTDDEPPSGLHVASWTGGTANMGFTDNSDNEDGFYVYGDGRLEATLGANVTTFSWTTACGQVRAVSVTAFNATGESGATNTINVAGAACP